MNMKNIEIRDLIEKRRLKHFEVAAACGVNPATFSRWLQTELSDERKARIKKAINSLVGASEKIKEEMCDHYCKMPEFYLSQYKDPDEAHEVMVNECCAKCPLERLNK